MESSNLRLIEEIQALRRREERQRLLLDNLQDLICLTDEEGVFQYVSPSHQDELGYGPEDLLGKSAFIWVHPDDLENVREKFQALAKTGMTQEVSYRYQSATGKYLWFQSRGKLVRDSQGGVIGVVVSSRNITLRKKMEESLRESEERYRSLVEHAPAFITINDREGRMLFINRVLPEYDRKQVYQSSTYDHILPEYHDQVRSAFEKVFCEGIPQTYQLQGRRPDGEIVWYQTHLGPIWEGKTVVAATQVAIDITPLKKAEEGLRDHGQRLQLILEGTDEGLWDWDVVKGEIRLDDNWIRVLGYVPGEGAFDFAWWESSLHPDSRPVFEQALADYLEGRTKYYEIEYRMRAKSGEWRWIWARGVCMDHDREGRPLRLIGTHRDITERKRTEEALGQAEANYQTLVEQSVQGLVVMEGGQIVFANSALADICGYAVEELQSLSPEQVTALIHPEDQALVWGHFQDRLAGKGAPSRYQYRGVSKDGSVRWLEMAANRISYGGKPAIQGSIIDITERKLAEEALKQANLIVENSPAILFRWKATEGWPVEMVSQNVSQFGYTPEELLSGAVPFAAMVHPDDLDRVAGEVEEYSAGGWNNFQQDYRIVTKDGRERWLDDRTIVERNAEGRITFYQGIVIDITERKAVETVLQNRERELTLLTDNMIDVISYIDRDRVIRYMSPSVRFLLGHKPGEMIGQPALELVHPDDRERLLQETGRALAENAQTLKLEFRYQRAAGDYSWLESLCRFMRDDQGKLQGTIFSTRDIAQRKKIEEALRKGRDELEARVEERTAELEAVNENLQREIRERVRAQGEAVWKSEELKKSQARLQAVFDGITDPLVMLDQDLMVIMLNHAAQAYFGENEIHKVIEPICIEAFGEDGDLRPCGPREQAVSSGQAFQWERTGLMDPHRWENVMLYPVKEEEKGVEGIILRIADITEKKIAENQLVQRQKMEALGILISGIAHEINNPNNFISFNMPILQDYLDALLSLTDETFQEKPDLNFFGMTYPEFREDVFRLLENVRNGSERINAIISQLKTFSRKKGALELRETDLGEVVDRVLALSRNQLKKTVQSLEVDLADNLPSVRTDPEALKQVLLNLLINGAQAADKPDARIKVTVQQRPDFPKWLILEVADNGCGIEAEILERIFNPFFTTKKVGEGTGLGLYVCQNLVENLGGRIEVQSQPGIGSRFQVFLPLE